MFDIDAARKSGVSDDQIEKYLSTAQPNFDVQGAMKAGASLDQIAKEINTPSNKQEDWRNEKGLETSPLMVMPSDVKQLGQEVKAGGAGIANLVSGQGLQEAAQNVQNVEQNQPPTNMPGRIGAGAGSMFTPGMIAATAMGNAAMKPLAEIAGPPISAGVNKLRNLAKIMTGPGEAAQNVAMQPIRNSAAGYVNEAQAALKQAQQVPEELSTAKTALPDIQGRVAQLPSERAGLVAKAGKNIQELEKPLGPLDSKLIEDMTSHDKVRSMMLQKMTALTSKGPDAVNEAMSAGEIRQIRQFVQEIARNPKVAIEAPQASQINTVLGKAMDTHIPGYNDALDLYKTAQNALEDVPNIKAQQLGELRSKIKTMESAFTNSKLEAADQLAKAKLNAQQIMQKADMMVQQGKLSDVYRQRLYKGIIATGILGGASKILSKLGGQ